MLDEPSLRAPPTERQPVGAVLRMMIKPERVTVRANERLPVLHGYVVDNR
jgi:hypothetical protein